MGIVNVKQPGGESLSLEAVDGWRLMEILREYGLPMAAICGGACACATCHIRIAAGWADKLPAPREDEEDMLDTVPNAGPGSRLSCQIIWDEALDGLEVELLADAAF